MAENKNNLYELQKKIPYELVAPILAAWDEQSDRDITDLAKMAYDAGRNSISKEKNKMAEIARLFGKKLGEHFKVRHRYCVGEYTAYFTKDGYMVKTTRDSWKDDSLLVSLISGKSVIVDEV